MIDFFRVPFWVYGHSFTVDPGLQQTPDKEWMRRLAAQLGSPSWRTLGVGGSRMIDLYGDLARLAPVGGQAESAWPDNETRRGFAVLQGLTNDAICPAAQNGSDALPLNGQAVRNWEETLLSCVALLSGERRVDFSQPSAAAGNWAASAGSMYLGGSNIWSDQQGAWREVRIAVNNPCTLALIAWDVSSAVSTTDTGDFVVSIDGSQVAAVAGRTAGWTTIHSRRGAGWDHQVGPRPIFLPNVYPGIHTVRVTTTSPQRVYLDQLVMLSPDPVPVLVVKDPPLAAQGEHWAFAERAQVMANRHALLGAVNRVTGRFQNAFGVSLAGIRSGDYLPDGIHLADQGMDYQADQIMDTLIGLSGRYEPDALYLL